MFIVLNSNATQSTSLVESEEKAAYVAHAHVNITCGTALGLRSSKSCVRDRMRIWRFMKEVHEEERQVSRPLAEHCTWIAETVSPSTREDSSSRCHLMTKKKNNSIGIQFSRLESTVGYGFNDPRAGRAHRRIT
ncbi:hypothetical protein EVAR_38781_1 [Eumeta japonica]|uniref:Uncharacterized protein n=1 Tax=Eumeta variegata TaxID=151549 RepID=A0A4C1WMP2_EUMVA|nr:hypothetical protein EVAR_38781_1 [Eumeta japonica]